MLEANMSPRDFLPWLLMADVDVVFADGRKQPVKGISAMQQTAFYLALTEELMHNQGSNLLLLDDGRICSFKEMRSFLLALGLELHIYSGKGQICIGNMTLRKFSILHTQLFDVETFKLLFPVEADLGSNLERFFVKSDVQNAILQLQKAPWLNRLLLERADDVQAALTKGKFLYEELASTDTTISLLQRMGLCTDKPWELEVFLDAELMAQVLPRNESPLSMLSQDSVKAEILAFARSHQLDSVQCDFAIAS